MGVTTKLFKTLVCFDDSGAWYKVDTIEYEGKMWLVPDWIDMPEEKCKRPTRIICLDALRHQNTPQGSADFLLTYPMPKSVWNDGKIPSKPEDVFVVIEEPNIRATFAAVH